MNTEIKNQIESLANKNSNEEICGFIYHNMTDIFIYPCENISLDKKNNFEISADDYLKCLKLGKILAIYHSHPDTDQAQNGFSKEDLETADEIEIPMRMYSVRYKEWHEYIPKGYNLPLIGEPFLWGEKDCFGLIRTFLRQEKGIYLNDYPRDKNFQHSDNNQILENIEKENYYSIGSTALLKKHDILLFNSGRANVQHMAVFMGNSRILHHPLNSLSIIDIFNDKWQQRLQHVLRHK